MIDLKQFLAGIQQLSEEKGIPREKVIEAVEMALAAAYKKEYGERGQIIKACLDEKTGKFKLEQIKQVVDESMLKAEEEPEEGAGESKTEEVNKEKKEKASAKDKDRSGSESVGFGPETITAESEEDKKIRFNPERHIMIEEAKKIKKGVKVGDEVSFDLEYKEDYGRIAAQTAKQVIVQRLREVERNALLDEFKSKEGKIISGTVQRIEGPNVFLDVGKTTAVLPAQERVPREQYRIGERLSVYVVSVEEDFKGPRIVVSRSHPRFVSGLFEMEVPEIASGVVQIKNIAREAGSRTKIAVFSNESNIDPIGSCVGQKGTRIATIIQELNGEKMDIVEWNDDPLRFVANALSPAKVTDVEKVDAKHEMIVLVPLDQLSLAIGRGGQNVRLAAKLTTWRIDVRSAQNPKESVEGGVADIEAEKTEAADTTEVANIETVDKQ
ncbi:MAG: Transcription termination factor NusA [candidate division CPR1 bacterium GW2011_GWA2_42_17]|uniref:Transcription termination/antitermination protein NusA n=1 Tax=candidate division CPR1 bacterium GW2011_GWA2_42_17 TaxID=1618341 RepID=A0A0G1BE45_9BACT|nr:MAG: Transcription termination factor NusA [candidate division CPR1 bacterium GW2011_GWA2_42_17]